MQSYTRKDGGLRTAISKMLVRGVLLSAALAACQSDNATAPEPVIPAPESVAFTLAPPGSVWGQQVGDLDGVAIYSNSDVGKPATQPSWSYGLKWECVEFARRYTSKQYGRTLPRVTSAVDFWTASGMPTDLRRVSNGGVELPQKGDLPIMANGGHGHVVVVASASSSSVTIAQQNTARPTQPLSVSTSSLAGSKTYRVSALTGYTTLGWYTRRPRPVLSPRIHSHSPVTPKVSTRAQTLGLVTSGVAPDDVSLYLFDPYGNKVTFKGVNLSFTPNGIVFKPNLYQSGRWALQLASGGALSAKYTFSVIKSG